MASFSASVTLPLRRPLAASTWRGDSFSIQWVSVRSKTASAFGLAVGMRWSWHSPQ